MKKIMILCIALLLTSCADEKLDEPIQRDDLIEEDLFGNLDVTILYLDSENSGVCEAMINYRLLQGPITFKENYYLQIGDEVTINNYNFHLDFTDIALGRTDDEGKTYKFARDFAIEGAEIA